MITDNFGWLYLIVVFLMVIFALAVAFSPLGKLKMGKDDDKPEYSNFHWGIHPWVIYAIGGLALGYFAFKKDRPFLVSSAFEPLIGEERVKGPIGKAIDVPSPKV